MASIVSVRRKDRDFFLEVKTNPNEYESLEGQSRDIIVTSVRDLSMNESLTTGTLGNSYRIMLPKRLMLKYDITNLPKKASAKIIDHSGDRYLLIRIHESRIGIPEFKED